MKKSRFTESQVVAILQEGEAGVPVAQLARKRGISPATYYHWKSKYAGAGVPELKRLGSLPPAGYRERLLAAETPV
jgi:putative transposase